MYYAFTTSLILLFATIFSFKELDSNYSAWVGIYLGASSLFLAITYSHIQSKESKRLIESINELKTSIEEFEIKQESSDQLQQVRLHNIEKELKVYQEKRSSTNLLSIFINRNKWE